MRYEVNSPFSFGLLPTILIMSSSWNAAQAQLSVEDFPDLAPTDFSYVSQQRRDAFADEALQRSTEPFKIFDNLYYVGFYAIGAWILDTGDGLILFDALNSDRDVETVLLPGMRELGLDRAT